MPKALKPDTIIQTDIARYSLVYRHDGIFHWHVKEIDKWRLEDFREVLLKIKKLLDQKKVPVMLSFDKKAIPSMQAIEYWAHEKMASELFSADAIILDSVMLKVVGNFYMDSKTNTRLTKFFETEEAAINWLREFV